MNDLKYKYEGAEFYKYDDTDFYEIQDFLSCTGTESDREFKEIYRRKPQTFTEFCANLPFQNGETELTHDEFIEVCKNDRIINKYYRQMVEELDFEQKNKHLFYLQDLLEKTFVSQGAEYGTPMILAENRIRNIQANIDENEEITENDVQKFLIENSWNYGNKDDPEWGGCCGWTLIDKKVSENNTEHLTAVEFYYSRKYFTISFNGSDEGFDWFPSETDAKDHLREWFSEFNKDDRYGHIIIEDCKDAEDFIEYFHIQEIIECSSPKHSQS